MAIKITDIRGEKPRFTQWEVDRVLSISGTTARPQLRFANERLHRALVVVAESEGQGWICKVPNFALQFAGPLFISVFAQDENEGREEGKLVCGVEPRLKPQDYTYTENIGYVNWVEKSAEAQAFLDACASAEENFTNAARAAANTVTGAGVAALIELNARKEEAVRDAKEQVQRTAQEAEKQTLIARSWAEGGTGERIGEDENNARFWAEVAQQGADRSGYAIFNVEKNGHLYVTITDQLSKDIAFSVNETNGHLEVIYNE